MRYPVSAAAIRVFVVLLLILFPSSSSEEAAAQQVDAGSPKFSASRYSGSCTSTDCHGSLLKNLVIHSPLTTNSCDSCHTKDPSKAHAFTFSKEGAELCFECHDEYEQVHVHQPAAAGQCLTCHNPHSSTHAKLLKGENPAALCNECHDDLTENLSHLHAPVASGACNSCHAAHASDHEKLLTKVGSALCLDCHTDLEENLEERAHVHQPAKAGCLTCHQAHGGAGQMFLVAKTTNLCIECHEEIFEDAEDSNVKHVPVLEDKACLTCHAAHASDFTGITASSQDQLCLECHKDDIRRNGDVVVRGLGGELFSLPHIHSPLKQKNCTPCHKPHGSDDHDLLAGVYTSKFYAVFDEQAFALCFDCHDVEAFDEAETEDVTGFRNGTRNLHYLHVNRKFKGRSCRACHVPHASTNPKLIADKVPFGAWQIPLKFTKTDTGGSCGPGCHRSYAYDRLEPVTNIAPE